MSTFAFFLLCAQACLIQSVFANYCGKDIDIMVTKHDAGCDAFAKGYGFEKAPSAYGFAGRYGYGGALVGKAYPGKAAAYGAIGEGELAVSGDLPVAGNTRIAGQVPAIGAVQFSGSVPAAGQVSLCGQCGCDCHQYYKHPC